MFGVSLAMYQFHLKFDTNHSGLGWRKVLESKPVRIYFSICNSTLYVGEVTVQRKAAYIDNVLYIIENFPYFLKVCNC